MNAPTIIAPETAGEPDGARGMTTCAGRARMGLGRQWIARRPPESLAPGSVSVEWLRDR